MIDLHSHLIYGIDDGSRSLNESLNLIKRLSDVGFEEIVCTPHYMDGAEYITNNIEKAKRLDVIREELKRHNVNVKLYLGNEIYITNTIDELIKDNKISTINNTHYILVEIPLYNEINNLDSYFHELKVLGYKIILAHPERYLVVQKNKKLLHEFKENGIYLQSNYGSIVGIYGKSAQKIIKYMLKNNLVDFLGTDLHREDSTLYKEFEKIIKKLKKLVSEDTFDKITRKNIEKVLRDEEI